MGKRNLSSEIRAYPGLRFKSKSETIPAALDNHQAFTGKRACLGEFGATGSAAVLAAAGRVGDMRCNVEQALLGGRL
jgi:hypothetical protein